MVNLKQLLTKICQSIYTLLSWKDTATSIISNNAERGTRIYSTVSSVARTGNYTDLTSIDLGPGMWFIYGRVYYPSNTTGYRGLYIGTKSAQANQASQTYRAVQSTVTRITVGCTMSLSASNTTIYLVGYCNASAVSTITNAGLYAFKLGPYLGGNLQPSD